METQNPATAAVWSLTVSTAAAAATTNACVLAAAVSLGRRRHAHELPVALRSAYALGGALTVLSWFAAALGAGRVATGGACTAQAATTFAFGLLFMFALAFGAVRAHAVVVYGARASTDRTAAFHCAAVAGVTAATLLLCVSPGAAAPVAGGAYCFPVLGTPLAATVAVLIVAPATAVVVASYTALTAHVRAVHADGGGTDAASAGGDGDGTPTLISPAATGGVDAAPTSTSPTASAATRRPTPRSPVPRDISGRGAVHGSGGRAPAFRPASVAAFGSLASSGSSGGRSSTWTAASAASADSARTWNGSTSSNDSELVFGRSAPPRYEGARGEALSARVGRRAIVHVAIFVVCYFPFFAAMATEVATGAPAPAALYILGALTAQASFGLSALLQLAWFPAYRAELARLCRGAVRRVAAALGCGGRRCCCGVGGSAAVAPAAVSSGRTSGGGSTRLLDIAVERAVASPTPAHAWTACAGPNEVWGAVTLQPPADDAIAGASVAGGACVTTRGRRLSVTWAADVVEPTGAGTRVRRCAVTATVATTTAYDSWVL